MVIGMGSEEEPPSPGTPPQGAEADHAGGAAPLPPPPGGRWAAPWAALPLGVYTAAWQRRALSNLDYLLALNRLAGRTMGDNARHPVVPWVIDMSVAPELGGDGVWPEGEAPPGWRDLTKTKWRLTKARPPPAACRGR